jgi:AcrR family transcriptional regulator
MAPSEERTGGREARRLETRERLIEAAVAQFEQVGVAEADIGAIVRAAGVARGTFYFHFPTKEHVLAEVERREEELISAELTRYLESPHDLGSTLAEVVRLVMTTERRLGKVLFKDVLALHFSPTRPAADQWADHPVVVLVVEELERARERGALSPEADPANGAVFFLLGLYALLVALPGSRSARTGVLDDFVASTLRSLRPR